MRLDQRLTLFCSSSFIPFLFLTTLKRILSDIYAGNIMDFTVGNETITIAPLAGVRQGDALSTTIFNLAAEPLLRTATPERNSGMSLPGHTVKATAYAEDIAVLSTSAPELQKTLDHLSRVAVILGLKFNAKTCACLNFHKGVTVMADLLVDGRQIRCLGPEDRTVWIEKMYSISCIPVLSGALFTFLCLHFISRLLSHICQIFVNNFTYEVHASYSSMEIQPRKPLYHHRYGNVNTIDLIIDYEQ